MSTAKQLGKSRANRLVEIKDHLLYISEVLKGMRLLESHMNESAAKVNRINEMASRLEAMSVHELMVRVKALKDSHNYW